MAPRPFMALWAPLLFVHFLGSSAELLLLSTFPSAQPTNNFILDAAGRRPSNISLQAAPFPPRNVVPSMLNVAANHANASTVGLLLRSPGADTRLLVGATYTGYGSQFFTWNQSVADHRFENSPEISIRALNTTFPSHLFTFDISPSDDNIFKVKQSSKSRHRLVFIRAFRQGGFGYLAMNLEPAPAGKESRPSSVIARICLTLDPRGEPRKLTESYIQLGLRCEGPKGSLYGRLVSIFAEPGRIFGVFEGRGDTALCAYQLGDVGKEIREARNGCFGKQDHGEVQVLDSVVQGSGPSCERRNIKLQEEQMDCGAAHLQHPLTINRPLSATPLFKAPGLTSVAVANVSGYTVAFLGTAGGQLLKITLDVDMKIASRQSLLIARGEPVHHIMRFDPVNPTYLYVMTTHQMVKVKVADCDKFQTCAECLEAADAYCGWCTMEARCSMQQECSNSEDNAFWTSPRGGVQQCPAVGIIPDRIDITSETQTILLQITGNLPRLESMNSSCDYGNGVHLPARIVHDNEQQWAHCSFLPQEKFPEFPTNEDHVNVTLGVTVGGIHIAENNFVIYDCERTQNIHPKTSCTSCVTSVWPCIWSVSQHKCVSNSSQHDSVVQVATDCPQITTTYLPPTPTGTPTEFTLTLANVRQDLRLECDFGPGQTFPAKWLNSSSVSCSNVWLQTLESSRKFPVNLQLNNPSGRFLDNPGAVSVEVYNCASEPTDCSRCLGRTDLGHLCTWSESSASCRLNSFFISKGKTSLLQICSCSFLRLSPQIEPASGPLQGGTLLTILGRNLGSRFSDIADKVKIGDVPCTPIADRYLVSQEIVCMTGTSPRELSDSVTLDVNGAGHSKEKYSFMVPKVDSMFPSLGPRAGGTKMTITGDQLDIGGDVRVLFDDTLECRDLARTESSIHCTVPAMESLPNMNVTVCVQFERRSCLEGNFTFQYKENPVITNMEPRSSHVSGGRTITLTGERFSLVQDVKIKIQHHNGGQMNCTVISDTVITCPSPTGPNTTLEKRNISVSFYVNGAYEMSDVEQRDDPTEKGSLNSRFSLEYQPDPMFYTAQKEKLIKHHIGEPLTLVIHKEHDDLGLREDEYQVKVGQTPCELIVFNDKVIHCTINGSLDTSERYLPVTVQVGKFNQTISMLHQAGIDTSVIVSVIICGILLLLTVVALFVFCTKSRRAERYWQKTLLQMEEMESQIREEIRKGFAELQTDMTDLTKELNRSQGIPFLEYKHFVTRTFFPKCSSLYEDRLILPMQNFNSHLGTPVPETHPLLCPDWRFWCNLASLLTIALHGKLEYYTSIMKDLLVDLIDSSASKNPKLMLRRTESVVEKMLTNWMSICMYSCLRETVGEPFYLLLCAIKQQINKGSIDAITGKARYTLNEEWLLRENIEAKPMFLNVSFQGCGMDSLSVRALDTDTISQCKEKILEAFCKNLPFSQWPLVEDVDLEWFASSSQSFILRDLDDTSLMEDGRKKLNTVSHYKVCDGASLAMSLKDQRDNTLGRAKDLDTDKYFHLGRGHTFLAARSFLCFLLGLQGTLQKFLDDLFRAILSIREDRPPLAIKYFFDFLEEQAEKRGISDPDTLHIWKTNSLPLRFWVNILKNPEFVFDMEKSDHMDACLSVIAQAFIDACSISDMQLGKDSPTNKLLYAKEIPEYRKIVQKYYQQLKEMSPLSEQEMNAHLAEESRKYYNKFNTNVAVAEIYKYAKKYRSQIVSALEANPVTRRGQLQHRFEQMIILMEDDIYTCSSEA
ncbi:PREDICTED: plexin-D1 [Nanorana parkeri]|uniref:plexin-D1 n=1 Tax=Nanorana parkeri TaxID=125878 RepID=UPI000854EFCC|nr:PREDICTED: plexin-D1 [Nanorana parkeri]